MRLERNKKPKVPALSLGGSTTLRKKKFFHENRKNGMLQRLEGARNASLVSRMLAKSTLRDYRGEMKAASIHASKPFAVNMEPPFEFRSAQWQLRKVKFA